MTELSTNVCKTADFPDAIFMHSICACTDPDHTQSIVVESDEDGMVTCNIYQDLYWAQWAQYSEPWYKKTFPIPLIRRIKDSLVYIFTGQVKVQGVHLLDKEQHIRDYANALLGAADELKLRRERKMSSVRTDPGIFSD